MNLSKSDTTKLSCPYNSVYIKLFSSFDKTVLTLCQYYLGHLLLSYVIDMRTLNFFAGLSGMNCSPANILYRWFGAAERASCALKYGIDVCDSQSMIAFKINQTFRVYAESLI